ncbi:MAG: apolipoprotein N-acyltransferase [Treponema sp.]|nr:apolipoprotein N-acyltransferase [Treponema sp.]
MRKNSILFKTILLFLSAAFFALSEPSPFFRDGLSFLAWFAYVPYFLLLDRISVKNSFIWGALYGFFSYLLLCHWLISFGITALLFVCFLFAFYNSVLFFLNTFLKNKLPEKINGYFWIIRVLTVLVFEVLRTHGLFGFSYGIIGYSQWKNPAMLKFASVFGVFGVTFVILFFNSAVEKGGRKTLPAVSLVLGIFLFWGVSSLLPQKKSSEKLRIALIQNASSASSGSISDFEKDAELLKNLTDRALTENPGTELVVWAETAVVPSILYHLENSKDKRRHALSEKLMSFLKSKNCAFLIGNNHIDSEGNHNSAVFISPESEKIEVYNKNHLVPFTEFWPSFLDYKIFDGIKSSLGCDFFVKGDEIKVFSLKNLKFAVPVCFEDSFQPLIRKMKRAGADFFVNISDDAWSHSEAEQNIHLSMCVFRAAETSSVIIRSTIDGKTCVIDRNGKILSEIESGTDGFLCAEIEI